MRHFLSALLVLSIVPWAASAPPAVVEVPRGEPDQWSEVKATPGRLLVLSAEPASRWLLVDDTADLRTFDAGKHAAFVASAPGRYRLVVSGPDGTPARVVVVVGDVPDPGPGPKPPTPPVPPVPPVDELKARLKVAYDGDADAEKREHARDLAELYRQAAKLAASTDVATAGDLLSRARDAANVLIGPTHLAPIRKLVASELLAIFPSDAPLTAANRKAASELFAKLAVILDELGGSSK